MIHSPVHLQVLNLGGGPPDGSGGPPNGSGGPPDWSGGPPDGSCGPPYGSLTVCRHVLTKKQHQACRQRGKCGSFVDENRSFVF